MDAKCFEYQLRILLYIHIYEQNRSYMPPFKDIEFPERRAAIEERVQPTSTGFPYGTKAYICYTWWWHNQGSIQQDGQMEQLPAKYARLTFPLLGSAHTGNIRGREQGKPIFCFLPRVLSGCALPRNALVPTSPLFHSI